MSLAGRDVKGKGRRPKAMSVLVANGGQHARPPFISTVVCAGRYPNNFCIDGLLAKVE
jgi:hypothetical protein